MALGGFQGSDHVRHHRHTFSKGGSKIVFKFANNMNLYVEYPKEFLQNLLEPITKFKKVARYKTGAYYLSIY